MPIEKITNLLLRAKHAKDQIDGNARMTETIRALLESGDSVKYVIGVSGYQLCGIDEKNADLVIALIEKNMEMLKAELDVINGKLRAMSEIVDKE